MTTTKLPDPVTYDKPLSSYIKTATTRLNYFLDKPQLYIASMNCCGMAELWNVRCLGDKLWGGDPYKMIGAVGAMYAMRQSNKGALIFNDACAPHKNGDLLAAAVRKAGFGTIRYPQVFHNHNSGNKVKTYLWQINKAQKQRLIKWAASCKWPTSVAFPNLFQTLSL